MTDSFPRAPGPDWAAVARDYAEGTLTLAQIGDRHGISVSALLRRARREGWWKRSRPGERFGAKRAHDLALAVRLAQVLEHKMTEIETRLRQRGGAASAADSERDARTLTALMRLFDKLTGLRRAAPSHGDAAQGEAEQKNDDDADRLRQELARRLAGLRAGRHP